MRKNDVLGRGDRIRLAVRPFRIDVDEAHLHRAERFVKLAFAAVAFVPQPCALGTPVELFGLPNVGTAAAETERLEAHRVERDVAGKNHQIGPGDFPAVLLLDRPQQPARLVEVRVVRPRVERCETLLAGAGAAAAVGDAVGARAVHRHADHQSANFMSTAVCPSLSPSTEITRLKGSSVHQRLCLADDANIRLVVMGMVMGNRGGHMTRMLGRLSAVRGQSVRERGYYGDGGGLYLRVAPGGAKGWVFRYRGGGGPRRRRARRGARHAAAP